MTDPRGQGSMKNAKADLDHAFYTVTRRSRDGFFVYLNCVPVYCLPKKQTIRKSSYFVLEFATMKQC